MTLCTGKPVSSLARRTMSVMETGILKDGMTYEEARAFEQDLRVNKKATFLRVKKHSRGDNTLRNNRHGQQCWSTGVWLETPYKDGKPDYELMLSMEDKSPVLVDGELEETDWYVEAYDPIDEF